MGKWDKALKDVPRKPPDDPNYQYRVDLRKNEYTAAGITSPTDIVDSYAVVRRQKAELKARMSVIDLSIAALEQLIDESYDEARITSLKRTDGSSVGRSFQPHTGILDKDANRRWAVENGHERDLQMPWATLNSIVKSCLESGIAIPDGVAVYNRPVVTFRNAKGAEDVFSEDSIPA